MGGAYNWVSPDICSPSGTCHAYIDDPPNLVCLADFVLPAGVGGALDALADAGLPIGVAAIGGVIAVAIGIFVLEWLKRARKKDDE